MKNVNNMVLPVFQTVLLITILVLVILNYTKVHQGFQNSEGCDNKLQNCDLKLRTCNSRKNTIARNLKKYKDKSTQKLENCLANKERMGIEYNKTYKLYNECMGINTNNGGMLDDTPSGIPGKMPSGSVGGPHQQRNDEPYMNV
jgi:hypothetical protein